MTRFSTLELESIGQGLFVGADKASELLLRSQHMFQSRNKSSDPRHTLMNNSPSSESMSYKLACMQGHATSRKLYQESFRAVVASTNGEDGMSMCVESNP